MSKLMLVTGGLATLKTTVSKRLAIDLGILCLNKDDIKAVLVDHIGVNDREENKRLSVATVQTMIEVAHQAHLSSQNIIIEANFKSNELKDILNKSGYLEQDIITIFLYGDSKVLYDRYVQRQHTRHIAHTSTGLLSYEVFELSLKEHQIEDAVGQVIVYNTTTFSDEDYAILRQKIQSIMDQPIGGSYAL
jgi:dephospho-CoA kinase